MSGGRDREAPDGGAEASANVAEDSAAGLPGADHPGLSSGREAEGAGLPEERVDAPAEAAGGSPAQPGPAGKWVTPATVPPGSAPRVRPEPAAVEPTPVPSRSLPSAGSEQRSIHLSAGVALPQSLPIGTTMGFSVDYQFAGGEPGSSLYLWVIKPSKGQTIKQPVQLRAQGTLQGFFPPLRPENGPFSTHIEDAQGNRLSKSLPLR